MKHKLFPTISNFLSQKAQSHLDMKNITLPRYIRGKVALYDNDNVGHPGDPKGHNFKELTLTSQFPSCVYKAMEYLLLPQTQKHNL